MQGAGIMDIALKQECGSFSLRAAALVFRDDCLLLVRNERLQCCYTVGGRVQQGETTAEAARRECMEETGRSLEPERLIFVQERFYIAGDSQNHELVFFYLMQGDTGSISTGMAGDQPEESLCWVPVSDLPGLNLLPPFLGQALQALPETVVHVVSREP